MKHITLLLIGAPAVLINPVVQTTEAVTTPQVPARSKEECREFEVVTDIEVLRFGTVEVKDKKPSYTVGEVQHSQAGGAPAGAIVRG